MIMMMQRKSSVPKEQIYNNYKILKDENEALKVTIKNLKENIKMLNKNK